MSASNLPQEQKPDSGWDKDSLPPEVTPIRPDSSVPRLVAIASSLLALPAAVFIVLKIFHG